MNLPEGQGRQSESEVDPRNVVGVNESMAVPAAHWEQKGAPGEEE